MSWGFFVKSELASDRLSFLPQMGLEFFSDGLEFFWKRTKKPVVDTYFNLQNRKIFGELLKLVIETYFDEKISLIFLESSYVFDQVKRSEDFLVHFDSHGIVRGGSTASSIWADSITPAHRAKRQKAKLVH